MSDLSRASAQPPAPVHAAIRPSRTGAQSPAQPGQCEPQSVSPKLVRQTGEVYRYYAGFRGEFVESILDEYATRDTQVLDPWNGAGTTTAACSARGVPATGVDLNPFMLLVAKTRFQNGEFWRGIRDAIASKWQPSAARVEALETWFCPASAALLRGFERRVWESLGGAPGHFAFDSPASCETKLAGGSIAVALATRRLLGVFETSNPTWIRIRPKHKERLVVDAGLIRSTVRGVFNELVVAAEARPARRQLAKPKLILGDSGSLPLGDGSVDLVIGSPPYCTRLDYVVATLPELAAIGVPSSESVRKLRTSMLGGPSRNQRPSSADLESLAPDVTAFLRRVSDHHSKAASTHYLDFYSRYFTSYAKSLRELSRVLTDSGLMILVVQDSHFKDVPVELRNWTIQQLGRLGFRLISQRRHPVPNPKALNPAGKQYRNSNATTESVVVARREGASK